MAKRRAERIRRRVTCELQLGGRSYRGIVLDLSETGVFVQTEATPPPGARLRIKLHAAGGIEFEVDATVARRQVAPPRARERRARRPRACASRSPARGVLQADRDGEHLGRPRAARARRRRRGPRAGSPRRPPPRLPRPPRRAPRVPRAREAERRSALAHPQGEGALARARPARTPSPRSAAAGRSSRSRRRSATRARLAPTSPGCYPPRRGPLAQWQSSGLLTRWFGVRVPGGPPLSG